MEMSKASLRTLGVLGGLGPMSSVYFYEMLTAHTRAACDQEHLNILLSSYAHTPDRTAYILGASEDNPLPCMQEQVKRLVGAGADVIAIPCNTAHYFYSGIQHSTHVAVLNIIEETARYCKHLGIGRVGVLATEGTVRSEAYRSVLEREGIAYLTCSESQQKTVSEIIYGAVKQGREPDLDAFLAVADALTAQGCERIILGCTELSLLIKAGRLGFRFIDSLEVLALCAILACGGVPQGFDHDMMEYAKMKEVTRCC